MVEERLAQEAGYLKNQGYALEGQARTSSIQRSSSYQIRVELIAGVDYALVSACGADCEHVHMELSNASGPLGDSPEKQAVVILNGAVPETGTYTVTLTAPGCQFSTCGVGLSITRKGLAAAVVPPAVVTRPKPAPPPPPQIAFSVYENYDMIGGDLRKIQKVDHETCAAACRSDSRCVGYSYDKWNKWCFTKDAANQFVYTARSLTALREGAQSPTFSSNELYFERFRNKGFPKQTQPKQTTDTFEKCEELCSQTDWCAAFTYFKSNDVCQLYRSTGEYFSNDDADSGAKRQKTEKE
jgi:hypothetical protein